MAATDLKAKIAAIPQATPYGLSTTVAAPELPERAGVLSPMLQSIARNYLGARARAGEAILDSARYLAEARQAAQYGEWKVFLEATGTTEDTATRMLAIANRASADQQYARAIIDGRLAFTAAFELLNAPEETQQRALESDAPTPASHIRQEKQAAKLRTSAEFLPKPNISEVAPADIADDLPPDLIAAGVRLLPHGAWFKIAGLDNLNEWAKRAQPFDQAVATARTLIAQKPNIPEVAPAAPSEAASGDEQAKQAQIRDLADAYGLQLLWEGDGVILYWQDEADQIEQLEALWYDVAIEWLTNEAPGAYERRNTAPAQSDRMEYLAAEENDTILIAKAEQEIAAGDLDCARDLLSQVQRATYRRDQLLTQIDTHAQQYPITLGLTKADCMALLKEARMFTDSGLTRKLPTIAQALALMVEAIRGKKED